jgi:hypothetical protein
MSSNLIVLYRFASGNFAEFVMAIDRYFITDKINGITTVCVVVNDIIYIAGGNETYDFPVVGFNGWIFDAELVIADGKFTLYPFDIRHAEQPLHNMPFATRHTHFEKLLALNRPLRLRRAHPHRPARLYLYSTGHYPPPQWSVS